MQRFEQNRLASNPETGPVAFHGLMVKCSNIKSKGTRILAFRSAGGPLSYLVAFS